MKRYWKYIKPYLSAFIIGPILMIVEVVGEVLLPKFMANIINIGAANHDVPYIISMGAVMVLTALFMMAGGVGGAYFAAKAAISFSADLRSDTFQKVQQFSFANLDQYSTGSLVTRLTNDVTQVQNLINMALRMMLRAPGMLIGALIMAFMMNAELALVILVVIPVLVLLIGLVIKTAFPRFNMMQKKLDALNSNIQEVLTNVRVIKSFVRGEYEEEKFARSNEELKESSLSAFNVVILNMPIMMLIMNLTTLGVVWFGGKQILAGTMPVGDLTAFTSYIVQILMSLMMLAMVLLQCSRAMASLHRITEVLDTKVTLTDEGCAKPDKKVESGKVEFKDVTFRYYKDNKEAVLSHISFQIESGKVLGIIGGTGSGKTTLVQMIPRLYDADQGEILVDDVNVKDYSLQNLRQGVGMVLQKNVLFSGTILDNLRWGDENASEEDCIEACRQACADEFIERMPDKYNTWIEQGGSNVSGGQRQRLCIARALLKHPKVLILDDSTSAVDTATDAKIKKAFATKIPGTTKIIVSQRISSIQDADRILVLENGCVSGFDTHENLVENNKVYREIYEVQTQGGGDFDEAGE